MGLNQILKEDQMAIKALDSFQINLKLFWHCHQSLVKLIEHNRIQLVRVPGIMGIGGNEMGDELARQGSLHPLIGCKAALGISEKIPRGVIRCCISRVGNSRSIGSPFVDKGRLWFFLKDPLLKELGNYST
jgi:hypothetical protein